MPELRRKSWEDKTVNLPDNDSAFHYLAKMVNEKEGLINNPTSFNKDRHMLLETLFGNKYYCLFKREYFNMFNNYYPEFVLHHPNLRGVAESINEEWLDLAIKLDTILLFVHPDGRVYQIYPMTVKKLGLVRIQNEPNVYRKDDFSGEQEAMNEKTYNIPVKLLKKYD